MPIPPHRWFAFRLRTLFVVVAVLALPLAWAGYSLNWTRERRDYLMTRHPYVMHYSGPGKPWWHPSLQKQIHAPWCLRLLGEDGVSRIILHRDDAQSVARGKSLFPEAEFRVLK